MTQPTDPDAAARNALRLIGADPPNWVPEQAGIDHTVTIVGGGQTGCGIAFALRRAGIGRVTIVDAAADEAGAGIWLNAARMNLLRTPKTLPGPELGIPALSFQGWYEARHGEPAYAAIDRIPRTDWAEYLRWYRHFLGIPIRYRTRLCRIEPADGHFRLHLEIDGQPSVETTRKVMLATGFTGYGGPYVPPVLTGSLPPRFYAHTEDAIDFAALRGKVVAVIGAAASAFDAAGVALEAGAAEVHLFARRPAIAAVPISRSRGYPGAYDNYHALPDATRWEQAIRYRRFGSTPTTDAIERAVAFANFHLHLASSWDSARVADDGIVARVNRAEFRCDFVIAGTGYHADLAGRPELAGFAAQVLLWRDRFVPPDDAADDWLGAHPYLGAGHEYLEKVPGAAPYLRDIHVQNPAGFVSFGVPTGDVPSMKRDIPAIVARISRDLFFTDFEHHARRMTADVPPDFTEAAYLSRGS
jgi:cation diffusion facilitator CzcD-associated flavoprotein CzcO